MTAFLTSSLLLITIFAAFAFGIAAGYWVICGFLHLLNSSSNGKNIASQTVLASGVSGD